jgi:hypothetical protein
MRRDFFGRVAFVVCERSLVDVHASARCVSAFRFGLRAPSLAVFPAWLTRPNIRKHAAYGARLLRYHRALEYALSKTARSAICSACGFRSLNYRT